MKIYFSRITADHWVGKNNLEKAAHKLAKEMDRKLISEKGVAGFKKEFNEKVNALNQEFNRCKPLDFSIDKSYIGNDVSIWCNGVFHMELILAKDDAESLHKMLNI
jgi:hypothetical protein